MNDCLFCKIVAGEVPSQKVYEDSSVLAFVDINPVNPGHILVIPKMHFENCTETPDEDMAAVMHVVRRVGSAALEATGAQGYNVGINCGEVAGQVIMHTHVHVMPRFPDDGLKLWAKRDITKEAIAKAGTDIAELLKA